MKKIFIDDDIDNIRNIDLNALAPALGLQKHQYDKKKWISDTVSISITGQKYFDHKQMQGGGGAIDFTRHLKECSFSEAVSWLANKPRAQYRTTKYNNTNRGIYSPPTPSEKDWFQVRKYLLQRRGLSQQLIDSLHQKGTIYAVRTPRGGHVNAVFLGQESAEIKGIAGARYQGLTAGSNPGKGGILLSLGHGPLILTESGIDALSYYMIYDNKYEEFTVVSMAGARSGGEILKKAAECGRVVVCAYDADQAGDNAYQSLMNKYPEVTVRHRPLLGKDWNDVLLSSKAKFG